jgi:hypothetical protein
MAMISGREHSRQMAGLQIEIRKHLAHEAQAKQAEVESKRIKHHENAIPEAHQALRESRKVVIFYLLEDCYN